MKKAIQALAVIGMMSGVAGVSHADLVTNGGFELTSSPIASEIGYNGFTVTGWSIGTPNYSFIFTPGSADTTGAVGQYGTVKLWGPNDGSLNGLPATSPLGGNYLASDGAFQPSAVFQSISGLTVGQSYDLTFDWAAAQQAGFDGDTASGWNVTFGSQTQTTGLASIGNHGFSGWQASTMTFTATSATQILSFLGTSTAPSGLPPFSLLDGVSLTTHNTPEGSTMGLLSVGLLSMGGISAFVRRRKANAENAA